MMIVLWACMLTVHTWVLSEGLIFYPKELFTFELLKEVTGRNREIEEKQTNKQETLNLTFQHSNFN